MPLLEFHRTLLSDVAAQEGFRKALFSAIRGGETVLDVGTGTGIHAMFACQAARAVYAVEESSIIELAKAISIANSFDDRIRFIQGAVQEVELPEQVDVITAHLGLSDTLELLPEVATRHLRPGGVVIPAAAELYCAPLESVPAHEHIRFWEQPHYGLDFTPIRLLAIRSKHAYWTTPCELLADGVCLAAFNFSIPAEPLASEAQFEIVRDGVLHGIAMWYVEHLWNGIKISSGPPSALHPKLWPNYFLPSQSPVRLRRGDTVAVRFDAGAALAGGWTWEITVGPTGAKPRSPGTGDGSR